MDTQFEKLLTRHLEGSLTEEEKIAFAVMLKLPENQLYLAAIIDDQFMNGAVGEMDDEATGTKIFEGIREKMANGTRQEELNASPVPQPAEVVPIDRNRNRIIRLAVAAAVALILVMGLRWFFFTDSGDRSVADRQEINQPGNKESILRHEVNTSGTEKRLELVDGSVILLADNSEVSFLEPFADIREIRLKGKAFFKVARDESKPFTVISGELATTALGTEFTVTAFEGANRITIRLYEGKVVIKPVNSETRMMKKEVYLLPGQEFVFGKNDLASVKAFKLEEVSTPEEIIKEELALDNPSMPQNTKGNWFMFNNQPLDQVFDLLGDLYQVKMIYDKKDIENMYFIGKFDKSASLEKILNRISILNNLTITLQDSVVLIKK